MGQATPLGPAPRRLTPIFRDRDELSASGDLGVELRAALARSLRLVVVCSPAAARSPWVNEEILTYKRLHGEGGVLALIAGGEPGASAKGRPDNECFPPALRLRISPDGALTEEAAHPIAADMRREGDGRRAALLKLVAGLSGVRFDDLAQREAQRRVRNLTAVAAASVAGMAFAGGLALYANERRIEADHQRRFAEHQTAAANAAADFLVGTFALSNPATENPKTVTALTILQRGAARARNELSDQPAIQARLLETMGRAYNNLGLLAEARTELEAARPTALAAGADGAGVLLALASTYYNQGDLTAASGAVTEAERLLGPKTGPDAGANLERRGRAAEMRGRIAFASVRNAESERAYREALADYLRAPGVKPETLARLNVNLGLVLSEMGKHAEARDAELTAIRLVHDRTGDRHLLAGQAYYELAGSDKEQGRLADARREIDQAIDILQSLLEDDNPILAESLVLRGEIETDANQAQDARADLMRAIAIYGRAFKGPHYKIGAAQVYLALAESKLDHTDAALHDLVLAKANYDASYHRLHVNHGDLLVNRARILKHAGRTAEARKDCAAGLAILGQFLKPDEAFYKTNVAICAGI